MSVLHIESKKYNNVHLIELQQVELFSNFLHKAMQIYIIT